MKERITIILDIRRTNPGIAHDGARTSGFDGSSGTPITSVVLGVGGTHLVPHLMCDIVYHEWITDRRSHAGDAAAFVSIVADGWRVRQSLQRGGTEKMPPSVFGTADDGIGIGGVGVDIAVRIAIERISSSIRIDQIVIVCYELQADAELRLEDLVEPIHRSDDGGKGFRFLIRIRIPGEAVICCVFP